MVQTFRDRVRTMTGRAEVALWLLIAASMLAAWLVLGALSYAWGILRPTPRPPDPPGFV